MDAQPDNESHPMIGPILQTSADRTCVMTSWIRLAKAGAGPERRGGTDHVMGNHVIWKFAGNIGGRRIWCVYGAISAVGRTAPYLSTRLAEASGGRAGGVNAGAIFLCRSYALSGVDSRAPAGWLAATVSGPRRARVG